MTYHNSPSAFNPALHKRLQRATDRAIVRVSYLAVWQVIDAAKRADVPTEALIDALDALHPIGAAPARKRSIFDDMDKEETPWRLRAAGHTPGSPVPSSTSAASDATTPAPAAVTEVWRQGEGVVCVRSFSDPQTVYVVKLTGPVSASCSCPHWRTRLKGKKGAVCKHGLAALAFLGRQRKAA